jgi:hypothetical protein
MPDNAHPKSITVEELIEKLQQCDPKTKVYMYDETSKSFFSSISQIQEGPFAVCLLP